MYGQGRRELELTQLQDTESRAHSYVRAKLGVGLQRKDKEFC